MTAKRFLSRLTFLISAIICLSIFAEAQRGLRGQIFLPNGAPLQKVTRFKITTDDGLRDEYFFTDSNGRIFLPTPPAVPFKLTVDSDSASYAATVISFDPRFSGNFITVNLNPLSAKTPAVPGEINADDVDRNVSAKAREAYAKALPLMQAGQYEQAIEPLKKAISIEKNYFQAHNDLGVVYMKLNRLDEAEQTFRAAIKITDKVYFPQLNLGIVLNKKAQYKDAAQVLRNLQNRFPNLNSVHTPLIEALIEGQEWVAAEEEIQKALKVKDADVVDLQVKLGSAQMRQGKFDTAVATLKEATAAEPNNAQAHFMLGASYQQLGQMDDCERELTKAYEIGGAQMAGVQLLLGQLYFQKKEYQKALDAFEIYLRDVPNAPNAAQVKAVIEQLREALKKKG
ncbi:MAG: tetratricopeptide repeat protein [Acidobacteriota bacterium]